MKRLIPALALLLASALPVFSQAHGKYRIGVGDTYDVLLVDASGVPQTSVTITNITGRVFKHSNTSSTSSTTFTCAASGSSHDCVNRGGGVYNIEASTGDLDTAGNMEVLITATSCLPKLLYFEVLQEKTWQFWNNGSIASTQDQLDLDTSAQTDSTKFGGFLVTLINELKSRSASVTYGTAVAGGNTSIQLAATETGTDSMLRDNVIIIRGGTGIYQSAKITAYNGATQTATTYCLGGTNGAWITNPDSTSQYVIYPFSNVGSLGSQAKIDAQFHRGILTGTAQAGSTTSTIVLAADASSTNLSYVYWLVTLTGGTGSGQTAIITNYAGATRVATVLNQNTATGLWLVTPDNTTTYSLIPFKR